MSLAPGRPSQPVFQRSSSGDNLAAMGGFSTVQRPSTANFLGTATGRKSYAPVTSTPANLSNQQSMQESTARRSSVYSARPSAAFGPAAHQSFFATAPPPAAPPLDPRRTRAANVKAQMVQDLSEFLSQRNFEMETKHTLGPQSMTNPTGKDFEKMFQFVYHCIDPAYRFRDKFENEVIAVLKQLRYPFDRNINKSQITAVGSANWPTFLACLHWMMQLAKMMESYSTGAYDDACVEAGYDVSADRITFQFLSDAYKEWLSIEDDDDDDEEAKRRIQPHVDAMEAKFEQANQANLEQVKTLEAESKALQEQIDELGKSQPKLAKLEETIKVLEEDRVKFENYNQSMEGKVAKYVHRAELLQQEIEKCDQELREAEEERGEIQRKVDEQGLSVADIDRMNNERERLQKGVETTTVRLEEAKDRTSKKEAETSSKLDELESSVQKFNALAYEIGIIPPTAQNANNYDYEIHLSLNPSPDFSASQQHSQQQQQTATDRLLSTSDTGYSAHHILPPSTLSTTKSRLHTLRKAISDRRSAALEDDMQKSDMLAATREALDDKHAELETLTHRVRLAGEEFERIREVLVGQGWSGDAQVERMEKELRKMREGDVESLVVVEGREMSVNLE